MTRTAAEQARTILRARLDARRAEIEQAALTRISAIADPTEVADPEYLQGLRAALSAAVGYGLAAIESGEERAPAAPAALLVQARVAARGGVSLETVLRRYLAGYTLLSDFLIEEADESGLGRTELKHMLRTQATLFDRLLTAVSEEYNREESKRASTAERRRLQRVERLLAGELIDTSDLAYDFDVHHIGMVAVGPGAAGAIRKLTDAIDCRRLLIQRDISTLWAWVGIRTPNLEPASLQRLVASYWPRQCALAIGEKCEGLDGWRLTHRQATAALPIAIRKGGILRYADVALLASIAQDDLLTTSLHRLYLVPLESERDGGAALQRTLRTYFSASRNISSTSAAMKLSRQTVRKRLRLVEELYGRSLTSCSLDVEVALQLDSHRRSPEY